MYARVGDGNRGQILVLWPRPWQELEEVWWKRALLDRRGSCVIRLEITRVFVYWQYCKAPKEAAIFWATSRCQGVQANDHDYCFFQLLSSWHAKVCWCLFLFGRTILNSQNEMSLEYQIIEVYLKVGSALPTKTMSYQISTSSFKVSYKEQSS